MNNNVTNYLNEQFGRYEWGVLNELDTNQQINLSVGKRYDDEGKEIVNSSISDLKPFFTDEFRIERLAEQVRKYNLRYTKPRPDGKINIDTHKDDPAWDHLIINFDSTEWDDYKGIMGFLKQEFRDIILLQRKVKELNTASANKRGGIKDLIQYIEGMTGKAFTATIKIAGMSMNYTTASTRKDISLKALLKAIDETDKFNATLKTRFKDFIMSVSTVSDVDDKLFTDYKGNLPEIPQADEYSGIELDSMRDEIRQAHSKQRHTNATKILAKTEESSDVSFIGQALDEGVFDNIKDRFYDLCRKFISYMKNILNKMESSLNRVEVIVPHDIDVKISNKADMIIDDLLDGVISPEDAAEDFIKYSLFCGSPLESQYKSVQIRKQ